MKKLKQLAATTREDDLLSIWKDNLTASSNSERARTSEQVRVDETSSSQVNIGQPRITSPFRTIKDSISESTVYYRNHDHHSISEGSSIAVTAFNPTSFPIQLGSVENSSRQIAVGETSEAKINFAQVSSTQVDSFQLIVTQVPFAKVSSTQINVAQDSVRDVAQSNFTKVSLPSSITSQQLINSHFLLHSESSLLITPTANNDTFIAQEATPLTLNILSNDSDIDGTIDRATLTISANPNNGKIIVNTDGTIITTKPSSPTTTTPSTLGGASREPSNPGYR